MSRGTSETVECPICEETFDPTAAGGWCTNSDCGEWQYEDAVAESAGAEAASTGADEGDEQIAGDDGGAADAGNADAAPDHGASAAEDDVGTVAEDGEGADAEGEEGTDVEDGVAVEDGDAGPEDDDGPVGEDDDHVAESDDASAPADGEEDGLEDEELTCPGCGEPVAATDNFCANCGEDVAALEPGPLTDCPNCEEPVDEGDNFCANCGENLDAYRTGSTAGSGDATGERDGAGDGTATGTGGGAASAGADRSVSSPSESSGAAGAVTERESGASLQLVVRNREIQVWDGDTVGRKIRSIIMETGGEEEDAVRVHREHVRFDHEDGQFHLVALGQNPTVVNGERVDQGDRVPVSPGDRVELSNVAKMRVEEP